VKNVVDELVRLHIHPGITTHGAPVDDPQNYNGSTAHTFAPTAGESALHILLHKMEPDVAYAHGHKAAVCKGCVTVCIPCIVTAHHGGILCPPCTLLNLPRSAPPYPPQPSWLSALGVGKHSGEILQADSAGDSTGVKVLSRAFHSE